MYRGVFDGGGRSVYWIKVRQEMKRLVEGYMYDPTRGMATMPVVQ